MQQVNNNGEEVVYSSDGLSQLSMPNAPLGLMEPFERSSDPPTDMVNDEYDTSPAVDSRQAFEMFQGKLYRPLDDGDTLRSQRRDSLGRESLLEKLARLNTEIKELESDLSKIPTVASSSSIQNTGAAVTVQMKDNVKDLTSRLATLSGAFGTSSRSKLKLQKDLTSLIKSEVLKFSSSQSKSSSTPTAKHTSTSTPAKGATHTASSSSVSSPNSQHQNNQASHPNGIVYELYASIPGATSTDKATTNNSLRQPVDSESFESLEKRLRRIENFVGQIHVAGTQDVGSAITRGTLLQRLLDLEQKIHRLDDKSLLLASTRAKVIR